MQTNIAIIGGGIIGAAIAYFLACTGRGAGGPGIAHRAHVPGQTLLGCARPKLKIQ